MNITIYINDVAVDEPQGLTDLVLNISRHPEWHGIFFEASTTTLQFYGDGAALLKAEKDSNGLQAEATFRAEIDCGETTDILTGSFDFGTYVEKCGTICTVEISIEKSGCLMTLTNRYDQAVDLGKATSFDNTTLLRDYIGLDCRIDLPAQKISIGDEGEIGEQAIIGIMTDDPFFVGDGIDVYAGWINVPLDIITNESLGVFNTSPIPQASEPQTPADLPPYLDFPTGIGTATLLGDVTCQLTDTTVSFRVKGSVIFGFNVGTPTVFMTIRLLRLPNGLDGSNIANWIVEYNTVILNTITVPDTYFFDVSANFSLNLSQGDFVYWGLPIFATDMGDLDEFTLTFDEECYFKLLSSATCETSQANVSLINETGARIIESITDGCMTMKSDYYGREDSEPYTSDSPGCGALRVLTNGLKLRNATPSNHFISLQDFFTGLRGIDNIGMGIENDPGLPGDNERIRIEPVEYFYQDIKLFDIDGIPQSDNKLDSSLGYSSVNIGYQRWEVERVNGLNEFNSNKNFRTGLKTINNVLDATSGFVAGGIPIEITRQQSFSTSGSADTKYDNDNFIICMTKTGIYEVEFFASGDHMVFETSGDGSEFLTLTQIQIQGSVSNDGMRNIFVVSILTSTFDNRVTMDIGFTGGFTVDEVATGVTFPGVVSITGVFVEQGNISNSANIFSPATAYNWRIRPMYNLMRWFKSIAHVYINLSSTFSRLFFASGTGNYIAEGELTTPDVCRLESGVLAENQDVDIADFNGVQYRPIFKPETMSFKYPLSVAQYNLIKANPYGYLYVQCGNGNFEKAFIKSIAYKPIQGVAEFTLLKKY